MRVDERFHCSKFDKNSILIFVDRWLEFSKK